MPETASCNAGGEHLVERVYVGGDTRDQTANGVFVKEADVHVLQVAEDLAAQIEHYLLAGPLHGVGLDEFQRKSQDQKSNIQAANLRDADERRVAEAVADPGVRVGRLGQVLVDGDLSEERPEDVGHRLEHNRNQGDYHVPLVGTQVREQPPHQPAVIRFAYYFLFLVGGHRAETDLNTRLP